MRKGNILFEASARTVKQGAKCRCNEGVTDGRKYVYCDGYSLLYDSQWPSYEGSREDAYF